MTIQHILNCLEQIIWNRIEFIFSKIAELTDKGEREFQKYRRKRMGNKDKYKRM